MVCNNEINNNKKSMLKKPSKNYKRLDKKIVK